MMANHAPFVGAQCFRFQLVVCYQLSPCFYFTNAAHLERTCQPVYIHAVNLRKRQSGQRFQKVIVCECLRRKANQVVDLPWSAFVVPAACAST